MTRILCCLLLSAAGLLADVSGNWSGSFDITGPDGQTKADTAFLKLKQDGGKITGTAGPSEDKQFDIKTGAIEGDKITMEVVMDDGGVLKFDLTLDGDHIKGTVNGQMGDEKMTAKLDVTRQK
jgi:hypothetical protein